MAIFNQEHTPPERTETDALHALVKTTLGIILPGAGELFSWIITPPLARRNDEWAQDIGAALRELLDRKVVTIEGLRSDPAFLDVAIQATQAALRTSQRQKREALKNTILNAAAETDPPEPSEQLMFVLLIDAFSEWHLRILKFFQAPAQTAPLEVVFPALQGKSDFVELVCSDLSAKKLLSPGILLSSGARVYTPEMTDGAFAKHTTDFGDRFLRFIESP